MKIDVQCESCGFESTPDIETENMGEGSEHESFCEACRSTTTFEIGYVK